MRKPSTTSRSVSTSHTSVSGVLTGVSRQIFPGSSRSSITRTSACRTPRIPSKVPSPTSSAKFMCIRDSELTENRSSSLNSYAVSSPQNFPLGPFLVDVMEFEDVSSHDEQGDDLDANEDCDEKCSHDCAMPGRSQTTWNGWTTCAGSRPSVHVSMESKQSRYILRILSSE